MKTKLIKSAIVAFLLSGVAHAIPIEGGITFTGGVISFTGGASSTSTGVTTWGGVIVLSADPIFVNGGASFLTPVTMAAPWVYTAATPNLWSVAGFTFSLDAGSAVDLTPGVGVTVYGTGTMFGDSNGIAYDPTRGSWRFSSQDTQAGGQFSFSASSAALPDAGLSVSLFGLALLGLAGIRRIFQTR